MLRAELRQQLVGRRSVGVARDAHPSSEKDATQTQLGQGLFRMLPTLLAFFGIQEAEDWQGQRGSCTDTGVFPNCTAAASPVQRAALISQHERGEQLAEQAVSRAVHQCALGSCNGGITLRQAQRTEKHEAQHSRPQRRCGGECLLAQRPHQSLQRKASTTLWAQGSVASPAEVAILHQPISNRAGQSQRRALGTDGSCCGKRGLAWQRTKHRQGGSEPQRQQLAR
mmetsp:Transcript_134767/g.430664  ORF Transcript_134767/g.430664 Transcript_134767/m.430664 type:complete len:226 (+) Transcript_134767:324-1001(+)